ncbi:MAG: hypothetical protein N3D78_02705 [Candidatus Aenigmarchaeota archaeon]|nr:hypothetical protein [Candidatus Aenigmarchaeota archaeon]
MKNGYDVKNKESSICEYGERNDEYSERVGKIKKLVVGSGPINLLDINVYLNNNNEKFEKLIEKIKEIKIEISVKFGEEGQNNEHSSQK